MKNEPAFPLPAHYNEIRCEWVDGSYSTGMTMLEYYAGHALSGILSQGCKDANACAVLAFNFAEAMCEEAAKRRGK